MTSQTGKGVRVAVIDSGVNANHPHIYSIAGGVAIAGDTEEPFYIDTLGHGTAVMAAIQEKAPDAEYLAVRVFHNALRTSVESLLHAIEWSIAQRAHVINLSLGTVNPAHADRFVPLIQRAAEHGTILVSALEANGVPALPGSLPGVIGVNLDWDCPRESFRFNQTSRFNQTATASATAIEWYTSGYPRDLPNVPRARNLNGISFAVANMTGFVIRAVDPENVTHASVCSALTSAYQTLQNP
ncbi:MAG TPA: S8 family serine peptidase [Bryobacteraceae bacterium]|nr:S8 family serine peptidase [Bryobacteraceae bacterium]